MDVYDDENLELYKENLQECECRLRSLDKKFDELSASDRKAELEAIFALHKSIRFGSLLLPEVKTWTTNNNTLNKLLSRCYAEEEAHLNDANKSNTGNSNVAKEADVNNNSVEQEAEDNRSAVDNGEAAENHKTVDNEKRSAGDGGITPSASARPSRRGAQAKKAKTGKRSGRKKQKRTRQSNRKNGDRKNGDSKLSPPEDDSYIRNRTLEETENLPSLGSFSDREDSDCTMEEPEDTVADREEEGAREGNPARTEEENVTRGNIASEMEEEEVTRGDNAAEMEEEEVTRGDNVAEMEEEEVTRGEIAAERDEEEVTRGDNVAEMEEEEVTRGEIAAERDEEEVTRGDFAADREQEEVARHPPQSAENGTIDPNNSDPPESNGNSKLVASKAKTNAENPPSTSPESRKRKPASKASAKKPKGKKEVKIRLRSLSCRKKVLAAPQNGGKRKAPADAGGNSGNHLVGVSDRSAALSKSPPRKRAPMKELEANKTIEHKGQPIRPPTKLTENRACRNNKDTRKSNGNLKSPAPSNHVNRNADYSLTTSRSRERQPAINPTPRKADAKKPTQKTQLPSLTPRKPTPRKSNGANSGETTQLPSQSPGKPADRNNSNGRKEQVTVKPPPHNAKGNGRNDLAKSSNNDNTSARKPAQKRRPRRKRKPWNPRPRKTPSVRNKANARPEPDLRLQHQKVQPEQNAVINKSSHEPVENPGHPRTQANAPPTTHKRKIEDEVIYSMDHFYQGNILMRVVEGSCGRRVYPIVHPHCLRPVARNQPHIYEVERDPYRMYCYCQSTADGGMIGCDGQNCPHGGWIHYRCAGIRSYTPRGRWYCASCRPYYHDRGKPIYTCQEEIPIAIVKGEPPAEGIYGKGPSIKKQ